MKNLFHRILLTCLTAAFLLSFLPAGALAAGAESAGGTLSVTGYRVANASGAAVGKIQKGNGVSIILSLKDTGVTSGPELTADKIDVTRLVDSFSGGTPSVKITSADGALLTFDVTISGASYKGSGKSLSVKLGYLAREGSYQSFDLSITECVEYEPPKEPEFTPEAAPAPMILVSRGDLSAPIAAGQTFELKISFQNLSNLTLRSPVAAISPSDSLILADGSSSFLLPDIAGKKTGTLTVKLKALDSIAAAVQSIGVELRFNYNNNITLTQGSISDKVTVPSVVTKTPEKVTVPQPPVIVTRSPLSGPISAGQSFDVTVYFKNAGKTALLSPVAAFSTSDALTLQNDASTVVLPDIAPGESGSVVLKLKAGKEISSANQSVGADLRFGYQSGEGVSQVSVSDKVNLAATVTSAATAKPDSPVPNVIVSGFSYGDGPVAAGSKFTLSFTFSNTGRLPVENIVATVEGGESFTMNGSSNTFYYKSLDAGRSYTQEVPMQAITGAKTGAQVVTVGFKYEYVDGQKRASSAADIKLSIPIYQPDRFQLNAPTLPETINAGEELSLSLSYVNKGKSEISNVEATVVGEIDTLSRTQYLGNFESGKSGNISFILTPQQAGETEVTLKISYEDPNQQVKTLEFPLKLKVQEPPPPTEEPTDLPVEEPAPGISKWVYIGGGAALLLAVIVLIAVRKKKKAAAQDSASWDSWDAASPAEPTVPAATGGRKED